MTDVLTDWTNANLRPLTRPDHYPPVVKLPVEDKPRRNPFAVFGAKRL